MQPTFGLWDIILILVVTAQAGVLTYISDPRKKSLVIVFPFPFTIATLSLGGCIDVTNVLGLVNLAFFTYGVWFFYNRLKINIVFSIVFFAILYCFIGIFLAKILRRTEFTFWFSSFMVSIFALCLAFFTPCAHESPYRTNLPVWIKVPVIALVVIFLVTIKKFLSGFMTVFPMVGVIAAYEGRFMLQSICRQIPVLVISLLSLMMTAKVLISYTNLYFALLCGWIVFLIVLKLTGSFLWSQSCLEKLKD
ncbi:MAG: hypothetical protein N2115_05095 [bacterium]|nr:hypothetical protein [bacterium]